MKLPADNELKQTFFDLLATPITVTPLPACTIDKKNAAIGDFTGHGHLVLAVADLNFANKSGAAMTLIPAAEAERGVRTNDIPEGIIENYSEVLNVLGGLLNMQNQIHLLFGKVYRPGKDPLPPEAAAILAKPAVQANFNVQIGKYGEGKFTLMA
ncbi:MAG: hypothetical protein AB1439_03865 [candidate division FCPU426 bacterium]